MEPNEEAVAALREYIAANPGETAATDRLEEVTRVIAEERRQRNDPRLFQDGNGNGVRTRDIQRGADRQIQAPERLRDQFTGIDFGTLPGLPPIDPAGSPPGDDPIRLGSSDILTFSALGTSSSGSLYIRGRRTAQYVIRILGESGKTRLLKFDSNARQWKPL